MKFFSYPIILTKFINSYYSDENRSILQLSVGNFVRRSKYENVFYIYLSNANYSDGFHLSITVSEIRSTERDLKEQNSQTEREREREREKEI
jgi:hypothetical protein